MSVLSTLVPSVVAVAILLGVSAFFSSSESALFSLPEEWIQATAADESAASLTLQELRGNPHRLLVTLLVGNNLVNIAITSIVTLLVATYVPPGITVVLSTLATTVLILVFGEIVPKSYGLGHAEAWSLRVSRPIAAVEWILGPLVTVFDRGTRSLTGLLGGDQGIEETYLED
ncbi:Hemolysins or related protein [Halorhabdus sp. SVX81]|uniref:DUF21 domain-containing protein n=1 Tax=Halorhabdus sp. SVX81 TaxID=2978283 RepID=UPI0023DC555A|nr:DUF21 domain-containing protein [Halorhabdus sp. SVX81]WEL17613.1 Hemolysins or related protein [Halorhabdus sp. SVX81]